MAERRKLPLILRPWFILFFAYFAVYGLLRMYGIIEVRSPGTPGGGAVVAPAQKLERWRRQLLRAVYSLPMVLEEEVRLKAAEGQDRMTKMVEGEYRKATEKSDNMLKELLEQK